jgi:hypothetical protein
VGQRGETTVTDAELDIQHTHKFDGDNDVLKAFVFNRSEAAFVPKRWDLKDGAIVLTIVKSAGTLRIRVIGIDDTGIRLLGDLPLPASIVSITSIVC